MKVTRKVIAYMHRSIGIAVFVAFAFLAECLVRANGSSEELIPQIKVVRAEVPYINPKYFNLFKFHIDERNVTYNDAHLYFDLIQDAPPDTVVNISVYAANVKHEDEKLLLKESITLCKDSPKRNLWLFSELQSKSKPNECLKKGKYMVEDVGNYRFDWKIPNIHDISDYQYIRYEAYSKDEELCEVKCYTEWGYLNNTS